MDHWDRHAANWRLMAPPLRPDPLDVRVFERVVSNVVPSGPRLVALLLGATEELVCMKWPEGSHLVVLDKSLAMLERLKDAALPGPDVVVHRLGNWATMTGFESASMDVVLGDGCFTTLEARQYPVVLEQIHRVLRSEGIWAHRYFVQGEPREPVEVVLDHWSTRTRNTFHANKLRLLMALQKGFRSGVWVAEAWKAWHAAGIEKNLREEDRELVGTIQAYDSSPAVYTFPTTAELKQELDPWFQVELCHVVKGYWLSERCPIVICSKKETTK